MTGYLCSTWILIIKCYPSNVHISPLGGKFKIWNFFKQHQFLPDVSIFVIKYYFIPTLHICTNFRQFDEKKIRICAKLFLSGMQCSQLFETKYGRWHWKSWPLWPWVSQIWPQYGHFFNEFWHYFQFLLHFYVTIFVYKNFILERKVGFNKPLSKVEQEI